MPLKKLIQKVSTFAYYQLDTHLKKRYHLPPLITQPSLATCTWTLITFSSESTVARSTTGQLSKTKVDQTLLAAPTAIPTQDNTISSTTLDFSKFLQPNVLNNQQACPKKMSSIAMKLITLLHGEPYIKWSESEVTKMNVIENLQYGIWKIFVYWPKLEELRTTIPVQCNIKVDCQIGYLRNRHILIRLSLTDDSNNLTSKTAFYIKSKDCASLSDDTADIWLKVYCRRTTMAMPWISFPNVLPTLFWRSHCSR